MAEPAPWTDDRARRLLRALFDAAVASADPQVVLARHLPPPPAGRTVVVGAGKSAAAMAAALEAAAPDRALEGVVVTRYGHAVPTARIRVIEASHPVPDDNSVAGAEAVLAAVRGLSAKDQVLALMSGGASALMEKPAEGLTLAHARAVNAALLESGAPIGAMNAVRKHLSAIKGGRLAAAAAPATVVTLAISDVPGDDPGTIGSGPTVPDPSTWDDVRAIAARYRLELPRMDGAETPKPGEIATDIRMIATPAMALDAAAAVARAEGLATVMQGDALEGFAATLGRSMAAEARAAARPGVLLSGGETTVELPKGHRGKGGRNTEFLLALAVALDGAPGIWALAGDTDGIDGNQDAAGAIVGPDTLARARAAGLDPAALLAAHESYRLFDALGDLVRTGPTLTNVNDFRAILVT
jgi:glycerate 2-kinase